MRHGAADATRSFQGGYLHSRYGSHTRFSPSGVPDDFSYQRALASLRHREAMLCLDKAIHEAEMRRRISSMTSGLSSLFPNNLSYELSTRRHGATISPLVPSSLNPTLFSVPGSTTRMNIGGSSRQSTLGGFTSFGRPLRTNMMQSELPNVTSSSGMASLLSAHGSQRIINRGSSVGTHEGSSLGDGVALDRASFEPKNEHGRQSPER
jgi:hypothetical protein